MSDGKKVKLNLVLGILSQVLTIMLGVITPRLILINYGSEVNGLLSSITNIYSYIALVEAGVGLATVQALYRTVANGDNQETSKIMAATHHFYRRTGVAYLFAIMIFSVIYPLVVTADISTLDMVLIIIFNGMGGALSYFLQGKYFLLFQAEGKIYIKTTVNMVINTLRQVLKIVLMLLGFGVVTVQFWSMIVLLFQMLPIVFYISRHYKWLDLKQKPNFSAISQSKNVLVHQLSSLIFTQTDTIVLSIFCGLKVASVYAMYTLLFSAISLALSTISSSVQFKLGQEFHRDRNNFLILFEGYETYYMATVFALYSVANFFILPFMELYTAGVTDINYIDTYLPLVFISTYLLSCGRVASNQVINFAGHFKLTQSRSIFESCINLGVSLVAVQIIGIYGVLLGTIVALLYRTNDIIYYASHKILNRSVKKTYTRWGVNVLTFLGILWINSCITLSMGSYFEIFLWCIPYTICTLLIYFVIAYICEVAVSKQLFASIYKKK